MNTMEVQIMALQREREIALKRHIEEGRIRRALAERPERAERASRGVLTRVWHAAGGVPRSGWLLTEPSRSEREPRVVVADELATEIR